MESTDEDLERETFWKQHQATRERRIQKGLLRDDEGPLTPQGTFRAAFTPPRTSRPGFSDLPQELRSHTREMLPLGQRARAATVSHEWASGAPTFTDAAVDAYQRNPRGERRTGGAEQLADSLQLYLGEMGLEEIRVRLVHSSESSSRIYVGTPFKTTMDLWLTLDVDHENSVVFPKPHAATNPLWEHYPLIRTALSTFCKLQEMSLYDQEALVYYLAYTNPRRRELLGS